MLDRLEQWRRHIEIALRRTRSAWTYDDVVEQCVTRQVVPFFWDDAFMISVVQIFPSTRHYHIFMVGGNLTTLIAAAGDVIEDARRAGCQRITAEVRRGWERVLRRYGARFCSVRLAMEVPDG